jgi:hypothetical protein
MPENQLLLRFLRRRYSLEKIYSFQQYTHEINEPHPSASSSYFFFRFLLSNSFAGPV